jgi:hypothetical protein
MHIALLSPLAASSHSSSLLCNAHEDIDLLLVAVEAPVVPYLLHCNKDTAFARLLSHARFVLVRVLRPELLPLVRRDTDDDLAESQPLLSPPTGIATCPSYQYD